MLDGIPEWFIGPMLAELDRPEVVRADSVHGEIALKFAGLHVEVGGVVIHDRAGERFFAFPFLTVDLGQAVNA